VPWDAGEREEDLHTGAWLRYSEMKSNTGRCSWGAPATLKAPHQTRPKKKPNRKKKNPEGKKRTEKEKTKRKKNKNTADNPTEGRKETN
jgi:hypothetical protein